MRFLIKLCFIILGQSYLQNFTNLWCYLFPNNHIRVMEKQFPPINMFCCWKRHFANKSSCLKNHLFNCKNDVNLFNRKIKSQSTIKYAKMVSLFQIYADYKTNKIPRTSWNHITVSNLELILIYKLLIWTIINIITWIRFAMMVLKI